MAHEFSSAQLHGAVQPRYGEVHIRNRGRLPHWEKEEGLYFITFHLADSLPRTALAKIAERHHILSSAKQKNANLLPEQKALLAAARRYSNAILARDGTLSAFFLPELKVLIDEIVAACEAQGNILVGISKDSGTHYLEQPLVDEAALAKQLYLDQETYKREEQRRFEILDAHWDLPIKPLDLSK